MLEYKSTLKARSYLYLELKKAATLYLQGLELEQIKKVAIEKNIFLFSSQNRIREIASTVTERINVLDKWLLAKIADGNIETSKQLALFTILKTDRLFFEFMQEVYREKYLLKDYLITDQDFTTFFQHKSEQNTQVASWQDYTFYKLKQVYKRILVEAGFAKRNKKNIEITRVLMEKDVADHIKNRGDQVYLQAMLGEA